MLGGEAVDAVLLDLRMPGMDGLEVLRCIRAHLCPPPVAVLTAHATASNTIEAMRLGAFDHLTKPIGRDELKSVLLAMLAQRGPARSASGAEPGGGLIGVNRLSCFLMLSIPFPSDPRHRCSGPHRPSPRRWNRFRLRPRPPAPHRRRLHPRHRLRLLGRC